MPDGVAPLQRWSPNPVHRELLGYRLHKHAELDHVLLFPVLEPVGDGPRPLSKHVQPPGKSSPVSLQISHGGLLARRQRWRITSCFCAHRCRERRLEKFACEKAEMRNHAGMSKVTLRPDVPTPMVGNIADETILSSRLQCSEQN